MEVIFGHRRAAERVCVGRLLSPVTARTFSVYANSKRFDTMEQVKQAAREIADKYIVKSVEDISDLEKRLKSLQSEGK